MDTIHILQKTYGNLYVARIPLLNYLSERLPIISSTWKRDCVERVLNEKVQKDFKELDIYYLIQILQDRQNQQVILEVFPEDKIIYEDNYKLFNTIKNLRCDVMHPSFEDYTYEDFCRWTINIESFIKVFEPEKSLNEYAMELHQNEKNKLLDIIKEKVLIPAMKCETLPQEIKKSVQNTLDRLEIQDSAEGIIAFFSDALNSIQGKEIGRTLEDYKLLSFEAIKNEILQEYYS